MYEYVVDWNNIDLDRPSERALPILDPYSFDDLLLEIECNIREITPHTVRVQFELELSNKIKSALDVFNSNLPKIMNDAIKTRKIK